MEAVKIKIDLGIVTHDAVKEHPFVNVSINGFPQFGEIISEDTTVEIDVEIEDNTDNFLTVEYHNKDPEQDVVLAEDGTPKLDKRVEIRGISFDDIALDFWAFDEESTLSYESFDPQGQNAEGFHASKLSWNGRTTLKFSTPVYIWLLENL